MTIDAAARARLVGRVDDAVRRVAALLLRDLNRTEAAALLGVLSLLRDALAGRGPAVPPDDAEAAARAAEALGRAGQLAVGLPVGDPEAMRLLEALAEVFGTLDVGPPDDRPADAADAADRSPPAA